MYALYSKNKPQSDTLLSSHGNEFFKVRLETPVTYIRLQQQVSESSITQDMKHSVLKSFKQVSKMCDVLVVN